MGSAAFHRPGTQEGAEAPEFQVWPCPVLFCYYNSQEAVVTLIKFTAEVLWKVV